MKELLTVSEAARALEAELGRPVRPRQISDLFYQRQLPETLGPIVGGRRLIARASLPRVREALRVHGRKPGAATARTLPAEDPE